MQAGASFVIAEKIGERFERTDVVNDLAVHIYGITRPDGTGHCQRPGTGAVGHAPFQQR